MTGWYFQHRVANVTLSGREKRLSASPNGASGMSKRITGSGKGSRGAAARQPFSTGLGASLSRRSGIVPSCRANRSEEHTSELQSLMRTSYAAFCFQKIINKGNND